MKVRVTAPLGARPYRMRRTFIALSHPLYRTFWFGTLFSFLGMQMQVIARGFLAYDSTGKNSALGLVMLGFGIPQFVLGLWGGVIADRSPSRPSSSPS